MEETKPAKGLTIIHYNDVYELKGSDSKEGLVGGADRFVRLVKDLKKSHSPQDPFLVLFSGDLYNPSKLGIIAKGEQMIRIVNEVETRAACIGNHDLVMIFVIVVGSWRRKM